MIYNVVLVSGVQQSDSVIHIHILFHVVFRYGLSQDTEYSSLCYTGGPCFLSILYIIVLIKTLRSVSSVLSSPPRAHPCSSSQVHVYIPPTLLIQDLLLSFFIVTTITLVHVLITVDFDDCNILFFFFLISEVTQAD